MRDPRLAPVLTLGAAVVLAAVLLVTLVVVGVGDDPAGGEATAGAGIDPALLSDLADGGEVILFRHAITDQSRPDVSPVPSGGDCAVERNLSQEGIDQAARIGAALAALELADGPFLASPFCRGIDTALAMLGLPTGQDADLGPVQADDALRNTTGIDAAGAEQIVAEGLALLQAQVGGPDTVIAVTHVNNIDSLTRQRIEEGDAVVLGAGADGAVEVRGVIAAADW